MRRVGCRNSFQSHARQSENVSEPLNSALAVRLLLLLLQNSGARLTDYEIVTIPALRIAS